VKTSLHWGEGSIADVIVWEKKKRVKRKREKYKRKRGKFQK
jgi:hypothetical protein